MDSSMSLDQLRADFNAGSTNSMPIAGMIIWGVLGILALTLDRSSIGTLAVYIMCGILPLAYLLDRVRGRNLFAGGSSNPLTRLFLISIVGIALMVPLAITAARISGDPTFVVLGMAILAGVIWIPYGWAADDPVGMQHAIGRGIGCYGAFAIVPQPHTASAICGVVVISYLYSLVRMRPVGKSINAQNN
jgi:hypothetical protein